MAGRATSNTVSPRSTSMPRIFPFFFSSAFWPLIHPTYPLGSVPVGSAGPDDAPLPPGGLLSPVRKPLPEQRRALLCAHARHHRQFVVETRVGAQVVQGAARPG